jgi:cytochrome P450 monooxygenase
LIFVYANLNALKSHRFLEFQKETYFARSSKTWTTSFLGNHMVYSSQAANMKALSTTHMGRFAVRPIQVGNGAITPFTGTGVGSSDGEKWYYSRNLVKPYFERAAFINLDRLSMHTYRLSLKFPYDDSTVNMQPLCQRWVHQKGTASLGKA